MKRMLSGFRTRASSQVSVAGSSEHGQASGDVAVQCCRPCRGSSVAFEILFHIYLKKKKRVVYSLESSEIV